jgi:hypothetical protein
MKASNDLVEKYGWDKIVHGLIGVAIVAVCVLVVVFLFGNKFVPLLFGMSIGTGATFIVSTWKESKDKVPDERDIEAAMKGACLADIVVLAVWVVIWVLKFIF